MSDEREIHAREDREDAAHELALAVGEWLETGAATAAADVRMQYENYQRTTAAYAAVVDGR